MASAVIYIHGQGGTPQEAQFYQQYFESDEVIGLDYSAQTPWEAKSEFPALFDSACKGHDTVTLIANSIGAFFAMTALDGRKISRAFFISPIVNMEKLILDMMSWASVSEKELHEKGEIETSFGQTLSWEYLSFVREHPVIWEAPTHILYGSQDNLTSFETVSEFARKTGATLTVMENGEHWFHTEEQMRFLGQWLKEFSRNSSLLTE